MLDPLRSAGPLMLWTIVLGFVFASSAFLVGLFLPSQTALLGAGLVLAQQGRELDAWALAVCAVAAAVAGNQLGYAIGGRGGTRLLARRNGRLLNRANLARANRFFAHSGVWAVVCARWVPFVRTLAPMLAGAARMDRQRYLAASVAGAVTWVLPLIIGGYYGAGLLDQMPWLSTAAAVIVVVICVVGSGYGLWHYRQEMRQPVDEEADALV